GAEDAFAGRLHVAISSSKKRIPPGIALVERACTAARTRRDTRSLARVRRGIRNHDAAARAEQPEQRALVSLFGYAHTGQPLHINKETQDIHGTCGLGTHGACNPRKVVAG